MNHNLKLLKIKIRECIQAYKTYLQRRQHRKVKKFCESLMLNLELFHSFEGAKSSAQFEKNTLKETPFFKSRQALFKACLEASDPNGLHLEFGTYKGDSINMLARLCPKRHFYGFDSFEGLPETWTTDSKKGMFDLHGRLPLVRENVTLVKGLYDQSLPLFVKEHSTEKVSFVHIDCDLYSSTKTVLSCLSPMIKNGTILCFDEYYNYSDWEEGEYKAFEEFAKAQHIQFEYLGYIRMGRQVAIKILSP